MIKNEPLVRIGSAVTKFALNSHLPVEGLIRSTVFDHFCGGISERDCIPTIEKLYTKNVHSILDYSAEGKEEETQFDKAKDITIGIIEVYAKQFQWEARYAGNDNLLGVGHVRYIKGINTMGVDMTDKNSLDDIPVRELHLPKGRKVIFKFRSQDVLHSAYMPHFRAQMNCVPGMVTEFAFTPKLTTEEMRANEATIAKVEGINKIRAEKGEESAGGYEEAQSGRRDGKGAAA